MKQYSPETLLRSLNRAAESRQVRPQINPWASLMDVVHIVNQTSCSIDKLVFKDIIPDMSQLSQHDTACLNAFVRMHVISLELINKGTEPRLRDFKHGRGREVNAWTGFLGSAAESVKSITVRTSLLPTFNRLTSEHSLVSMICATRWPKLSSVHFEEVTFKPSELGTLLQRHRHQLERVTIHDCEMRVVRDGTMMVGSRLNRAQHNLAWFEIVAPLLLWMKWKQRLQSIDFQLPAFARELTGERQAALLDLISASPAAEEAEEESPFSIGNRKAMIEQLHQQWGHEDAPERASAPAAPAIPDAVVRVNVGDVSAFLAARAQHLTMDNQHDDDEEQDDESEEQIGEAEERVEDDNDVEDENDSEDDEGLDILMNYKLQSQNQHRRR